LALAEIFVITVSNQRKAEAISVTDSVLLFFEFDLHDFRASTVLKTDPVAHVGRKQRLANGRNPTDGIWFEVQLVHSDDSKRLNGAFFIFHRYGCAKRNAIRWHARRVYNVDGRQDLS